MTLMSDYPASSRVRLSEPRKSHGLPPMTYDDYGMLDMEMFKVAIEQAKRYQK